MIDVACIPIPTDGSLSDKIVATPCKSPLVAAFVLSIEAPFWTRISRRSCLGIGVRIKTIKDMTTMQRFNK